MKGMTPVGFWDSCLFHATERNSGIIFRDEKGEKHYISHYDLKHGADKNEA